jgi:hypothetical protein
MVLLPSQHSARPGIKSNTPHTTDASAMTTELCQEIYDTNTVMQLGQSTYQGSRC